MTFYSFISSSVSHLKLVMGGGCDIAHPYKLLVSRYIMKLLRLLASYISMPGTLVRAYQWLIIANLSLIPFRFFGFELIRVLALGKVGFNSLRRRA